VAPSLELESGASKLASKMSDYPDDDDGAVLRRVAAKSDMTQPMDVDFSVVVSNAEAANEIARLAEARGYLCASSQHEDDDAWDCTCTKAMILTYESVIEAQRELDELSRPIGGYTNGWGTFGNRQGETTEGPEALEADEREFYDSLGPERLDSRCKQEGCDRGVVQCSVFCRPHHHESVRGRASSFTH